MKLEDIFSVVLQSAIGAQYKANEYSAQLAQKKEVGDTGGLIDPPMQDNSFFPIPNSSFENVNVNLTVKLEDIKPDLIQSYNKVITRAHATLRRQFTGLDGVLTGTHPVDLAHELIQLNVQPSQENIVQFAARFFGLYVYYCEKYLSSGEKISPDDARDKSLDAAKKAMFAHDQPVESRYQRISQAVSRSVFGMQPYSHMYFRADDNETNPDKLCEIALNVNMRTFSWANYEHTV